MLDTKYAHLHHAEDYVEQAVTVWDAYEGQLIGLMRQVTADFPTPPVQPAQPSPPRASASPELGMKGRAARRGGDGGDPGRSLRAWPGWEDKALSARAAASEEAQPARWSSGHRRSGAAPLGAALSHSRSITAARACRCHAHPLGEVEALRAWPRSLAARPVCGARRRRRNRRCCAGWGDGACVPLFGRALVLRLVPVRAAALAQGCGWRRGTPAAAGVDPQALVRALRAPGAGLVPRTRGGVPPPPQCSGPPLSLSSAATRWGSCSTAPASACTGG